MALGIDRIPVAIILGAAIPQRPTVLDLVRQPQRTVADADGAATAPSIAVQDAIADRLKRAAAYPLGRTRSRRSPHTSR
jgi:hypothetical protein